MEHDGSTGTTKRTGSTARAPSTKRAKPAPTSPPSSTGRATARSRPAKVAAPATEGARRKTHTVVVDELRARILSGELAEGERLPVEEELTSQFGIARTTLREALRVLESQGLITIRRGRGGGPIVTHPDLAPISMVLAASLQLQGTTVADLDGARRLIEPQIAGQLARSHQPEDLAALEAAIELAATAAEANDPMAFGLAAAGVHDALVESSGNHTLSTLSKLLQHLVRAYYTRNIDRIDQRLMRRAVRGYRKLLEHIRAGDEQAAVAHWDATMRYTIAARDPEELVTVLAVD
jgi:GntR family transcriptional repressor for pyruvate dehydrogenase complex